MTVSPKTQALRYRIWAYANPRGWDVTIADVADAIGESRHRVQVVCINANWTRRMRMVSGNAVEAAHGWGDTLSGKYITADIVAGRIGNEAGV